MHSPAQRRPKNKFDRVILQFDYDCFYAQVVENQNPSLKALPLGIQQKNILATCNYHARRKGVRKLMLVTEARRICANLAIVKGEDLTSFRDVSKTLFRFLKSFSWSGRAERLGFDEVFLDVTEIIEYNMLYINTNAMADHFFQLSNTDPLQGFHCDLTAVAGCVVGEYVTEEDTVNPLYLRLLLGSHLAAYLRGKLENDFGYTSTCGISINKVLSKLVGSKHKPRNQTTLLSLSDDDAVVFMDGHQLRQIPGIGHKTAQILQNHILGHNSRDDSHTFESTVTAFQARMYPDMSPAVLETLLSGPGSERGIGGRIWGLLHGVDPFEVKEASDVPSQISIEDTYKGLNTMSQITEELCKLACSLIRRLRVDLVIPDTAPDANSESKWIARPKTIRLSTRSWPSAGSGEALNYNRLSRSGPLPSFIFDLKTDMEHLANRLVAEVLLPLLRRLHGEKNQKLNFQLMNICAANMVVGAAEDKTGSGRDIANMFRHQDEVLRPWKVEEIEALDGDAPSSPVSLNGEEDSQSWAADENPMCRQCGHPVPLFALSAHLRFHETIP